MKIPLEIRTETPGDASQITEVINRAFEGKWYAEGDEADLVVRLRALDDLAISLVAVCEGQVIGQIAFSPAELDGCFTGWFGLGPVAVHPDYQGWGVGSALMLAGFKELTELDAKGCILVGDPNFYGRFGFVLAPDNCPDDQPREYFMVKTLRAEVPVGQFAFHPAFNTSE